MRGPFLFTIVTSLALTAIADQGPCRYDLDMCSCKMGKEGQGICWDPLPNDPSTCKRRFCRAGWTCSCGGRTHLCSRRDKVVHALKNRRDKDDAVAPCSPKQVGLVYKHELALGWVKISVSRRGMLANDCSQLAWWHNGRLIAMHKVVSTMNNETVDAELETRSYHTLLEVNPGDLIAFRFRQSSYYCYNNLVEINLNGTKIDTSTKGVTSHFARAYNENWFSPTYEMSSRTVATDELPAPARMFVNTRTKKLDTEESIVPGMDAWEPRDDRNLDNRRSNWYFRIQLPPLPPKLPYTMT